MSTHRLSSLSAVLSGALLLWASSVACAAQPDIVIDAKAFKPDHLTIPANKRVKLMVKNNSPLPAEFEGKDFTVEKVIPGEITLPVFVGPLDPGTYHFFNDFKSGVTGTLTAK